MSILTTRLGDILITMELVQLQLPFTLVVQLPDSS